MTADPATDQTAPRSGAPRATLAARYRSWYENLPLGMQMIGLQVWLPVVFVIAFVFCYVFAFHAPAFKEVPVALVGPVSQMQPVAEQLDTASKDAVIVTVLPDLQTAKEAVRDGTYAAAYAPGAQAATLVIASADSYQLSSLAQAFFQPIAAQAGAKLTVDDLAPLPPWDSFGTSLFYLTLLCTISGYMVAMFVGMMGAGLKHWQRFSIFSASSILLPALGLGLARFVVHAFDTQFWHVWAIGSATSFAVGCVVNGLAYYTGRFVAGWALIGFVFLNIPASGGAYPPELVPEPFRWLHEFVTGSATIGLMRHAVYGVGPQPWHGWLLLGCYVAVGVALAAAGRPFFLWKVKRRALVGKPPSMMITAQSASLVQGGFVLPLSDGDPAGPEERGRHEAPDEHGRHLAPDPDDQEVSAEEADGDAVAAETGVAS